MTDEPWTPVFEHVDRHALCCDDCKAARTRVAELEAALRKIAELDPAKWSALGPIHLAQEALEKKREQHG